MRAVKTVKTRSSKNERFKTTEELAEIAAQEAEDQQLLALSHPTPPPPPPPVETAERATQVSPFKSPSSSRRGSHEAGICHESGLSVPAPSGTGAGPSRAACIAKLREELLQLRGLLQQGVMGPEDYSLARARIVQGWVPQPPEPETERCLTRHDVLLAIKVWVLYLQFITGFACSGLVCWGWGLVFWVQGLGLGG